MPMRTEIAIREALISLWPCILILVLIGSLWLSGIENQPIQYEGSSKDEAPIIVQFIFEWPEFEQSPESLWLRDPWQYEEEYGY